jgi:dolichyl-phosphate-mannose-protein mannosyltransferase
MELSALRFKKINSSPFWIENKILIYTSIFLYFFLLFLIDVHALPYDIMFFTNWASAIKLNGLSNVYSPSNHCDYMPGLLYLFKVYTSFVTDVSTIPQTIHYIKSIPLFFEVLAIFLIASEIKKPEYKIFIFIVGVLNMGYLFNTLYWFQIDGWVSSFMFFSFYLLLKKQLNWSVLIFVLALNIKFQAIILLPLMGLMWLSELKSFKQGLTLFAIAIFTQVVVILPFLINGSAKYIFQNVFNTYDLFPYVSLNAKNIWFLIVDGSPRHIKDTDAFWGLTYNTWGLILYITSILYVLVPLIYLRFIKKINISELKKFLNLSALLLCYFFFILIPKCTNGIFITQ